MRLLKSTIPLFAGILTILQPWVALANPQIDHLEKPDSTIRFATYNVSLNRRTAGALLDELQSGDSENAKRIAEVIQRVRPDVLLLNEFDWDAQGEGIASFTKQYLEIPQRDQQPIEYKYTYFHPVNTGVGSGLDLNRDGKTGTANDAFGFGYFPGQYGMVVLSKYEIDVDHVRTFQNFLWKDMPDNLLPIIPETKKPYYNDEIKNIFRLSSKSHWDLPIKTGGKTIHFLVAHPTPPVFDGDEDRNGRRNHDEIRLFTDYVSPSKSGYLYDDNGKQGGLAAGTPFVIAGDMNADPADGDSSMDAARQLTNHPLIHPSPMPKSEGGIFFAKQQGKSNDRHQGDPALDTGDFSDGKIGNLHLDYCLPSKALIVKNCGVFWPTPQQPGGDLVTASDHRMVWIDVEK